MIRPTRHACLLLAALALPAPAAVPTDPKGRAEIAGAPASLVVQPAAVTLAGPRARVQLVVTGKYADGSARDLTPVCEFSCESADLVSLDPSGYVAAKKNGASALLVKAGGQTARVPVVVKDLEKKLPVSFRHEVIAALNVGGCNAGACHGTPSGKGGFRLSLRGFDPDADFVQLTRDVLGRRTERQRPEHSLVLLKALGRV